MAEKKRRSIVLKGAAFLIIAIAVVLSVAAYQEKINASVSPEISANKTAVYGAIYPFKGNPRSSVIKLPAVNANNTGVSAYLTVSAEKGSGNVYLDINGVLSKEDTQHSARIAAEFAKEHENISQNTVDLFYKIRAFAPVIEGPSAGAAFSIATIAALRNETPSSDVMMTGTLNHDGTIGPSGKIIEKARAAKEAGAKIFLVPVGSISSLEANYTESDYCRTWGEYEYCYPEISAKIINVSEESGISIVEVATVDEALKYFEV